ncbi:hypothetical protein AB3S75_016171 [Citrus x aurantiifolia]
MLIQSSAPTSVEAAMTFAPSHGEQDLLRKWRPTERWKGYAECSELPKEVSELLIASNISENSGLNLVKRRKIQKNSVIVFPVEAETDEVRVEKGSSKSQVEYDNSVVIALPAPTSIVGSNKELRSKNIRSSKSKMGIGCCNRNTEGSDISNSDISRLEVLDEDPSVREFCVSVLRSNDLLGAVGECSVRIVASGEVSGTGHEISVIQSCKLCGKADNTSTMLLCDYCDEAFHPSCCNPRIKILPTDNWLCQCCSNLNSNVSQENSFLKSPNNSWMYGKPRFEMGRIALMLKYPEPYTSRVRIGESYQAEVPDWSDQISSNLDSFSEPLEMDPAETVGLNVQFSNQFSKPDSISNWLQCQEVLTNNDTNVCVEGTKCGKWRRAPFSEVQTDSWDCSCAILWDPLHSDCAVPQELETDQVLRQLKYIEELKSRLGVKKT